MQSGYEGPAHESSVGKTACLQRLQDTIHSTLLSSGRWIPKEDLPMLLTQYHRARYHRREQFALGPQPVFRLTSAMSIAVAA